MPAGIGTVAIVVGGAWLLSMLFGNKGGTTPGGGSGGGGSGGMADKPKQPAGGGDNVPDDVPVNPANIGGGGVWGDPSKIPADFNWNGNGWWVANDCSAVALGRGFAPEEFTLASPAKRQQITSLQSATTLVPGPTDKTGTLWNFLFHLGFDQGLGPEAMLEEVKNDLNLYCYEVDQWPAGFAEMLEAEVVTFYGDQIEGVE